MGILDFIKKYRSDQQFKSAQKLGQVLNKQVTTKDQRQEAMDALMAMAPAVAVPQLLKRFEMVVDHGIIDNREKEQVVDFLVTHKDVSLGPVVEAVKSAARVAWPIRVAEKIMDKESYTQLLLGSLTTHMSVFDEKALERNVEILLALRDVPDERVVAPASELMGSRDEAVRMAALECLESQALAIPRAREHFVHLLAEPVTDDNSRFLGLVRSLVEKHQWAPVQGAVPGGEGI